MVMQMMETKDLEMYESGVVISIERVERVWGKLELAPDVLPSHLATWARDDTGEVWLLQPMKRAYEGLMSVPGMEAVCKIVRRPVNSGTGHKKE
jgi:hypothetical protein